MNEITCGLGCILLVNSSLHLPKHGAIRAKTRGTPTYAQAQDAWRQLVPFVLLAKERVFI